MIDDFLSGDSGLVTGVRMRARARLADAFCDAVARADSQEVRLRTAARRSKRRRVLVLAVQSPGASQRVRRTRDELESSRHDVSLHVQPMGDLGEFQNLDEMLLEHPANGHDWLLVVDDDVELPAGFLDAFLLITEGLGFSLAQPAHRWSSHAAWQVTRRRPGLVARRTRFVEIGPLFALHARTFETLLPFPRLRFGWGLELHWSAIARERGWAQGVVDAVPVEHRARPIASTYQMRDAVAEARAFLRDRPYVASREAQVSLSRHRRWGQPNTTQRRGIVG